MALTQNEAIEVALGVATAMFNDDKEAREIMYADLDAEDLKRVLRWTTRYYIRFWATVHTFQGIDPLEAWSQFVMYINTAIANGEMDEEPKA